MTTQTVHRELPFRIGRFSVPWLAFMAAATLVLLVGIFSYSREASEGLAATGMRDVGPMGGATWGLYIVFVVYFVGVSFAGITVAALVRLFNIERLKPIARMAEVLTIVALVLGALAILADLGRPLRGIVNLLKYARPQSPFFGTFTLVISGYLFASIVYLYLDARKDAARMAEQPSRLRWLYRFWAAGYRDTAEEVERHHRTTLWLAIGIIPLLVVAHSTLGFVFGLQVGRPGWYGALQAPSFVVLAGVSGLGHLIVLAAIVRRIFGLQHRITSETFALLGRFMMALLLVYAYFMVVELMTGGYAAGEHEKRIYDAILTGDYAWIYWGSAALLLIPLGLLLWQAVARHWNIGLLIGAAVAVNIAAVGKRFLIVVPSQTHGALLPYQEGSYSPGVTEIGVILGLLALGALLIGGFMKAFPIVDLDEPTGPDEPTGRTQSVDESKEVRVNA